MNSGSEDEAPELDDAFFEDAILTCPGESIIDKLQGARMNVTEEIVIDPAASRAAARVFGTPKRAYIHDSGGKWLVDVLSDTTKDRAGAKWRTVWVRCIEQIQSSPFGDIAVDHIWKVDCNVEYASYAGWSLEPIEQDAQS